MLENIFSNVFGRPKNKSSTRNSQNDPQSGVADQLTGPFSSSTPQMPQAPYSMYPPVPYPPTEGQSSTQPPSFYPQLPFQQPTSMPRPYGGSDNVGTLVRHENWNPLDGVPFEFMLSTKTSTNLVSLDQLFREIKKTADTVERVDSWLKSDESHYDFHLEQSIIHEELMTKD